MNIQTDDAFAMLNGYVRYAMGRMSTAPSTARRLIFVYAAEFYAHQQRQLLQEIRAEIGRVESAGRTLGDKFDHEMWIEAANALEAHIHEAAEAVRGEYMSFGERKEMP